MCADWRWLWVLLLLEMEWPLGYHTKRMCWWLKRYFKKLRVCKGNIFSQHPTQTLLWDIHHVYRNIYSFIWKRLAFLHPFQQWPCGWFVTPHCLLLFMTSKRVMTKALKAPTFSTTLLCWVFFSPFLVIFTSLILHLLACYLPLLQSAESCYCLFNLMQSEQWSTSGMSYLIFHFFLSSVAYARYRQIYFPLFVFCPKSKIHEKNPIPL